MTSSSEGADRSSAAAAPHSALRKSFHFMPLSVPALLAALYLAEHSAMVSRLPPDGPSSEASRFSGFFVAAACAPHSAFRNWFQLCPFNVPAAFAALYLALHSAIVSALAGAFASRTATAAPASIAMRLMNIRYPPHAYFNELRVQP